MSTSTRRQVYWTGDPPVRCDITGALITHHFVDGRIRHNGCWAIMTPGAHARYGCGLGLGRGQLYTRQPDGRWLKTGG